MQRTPLFLFTFANQQDSCLNALKGEERNIRDCLGGLHDQQRIEFLSLGSTSLEDVYSTFHRYHNRFAVYHYGGHSNAKALLLEGGTTRAANLATLMGMQDGLQDGLHLVVLNGCSNQAQAQQQAEQNQLRFSSYLVDSLGKIEDVIGEFLDEQLRELEATLGPGRAGVPLQLLSAFVTDDRTKRIATEEALQSLKEEHQITDEEFQLCLDTFERMQIIRKYED